jgi:hypothetical protein
MTSKVLNILLALQVLGCPIWCGLGICSSAKDGCTGEVAQARCCCHQEATSRCPSEQSSDNDSAVLHDKFPCDRAPCDGAPCRCDTCQCLCGGAVLGNRVVLAAEQLVVPHEFMIVANDIVQDTLSRQSSRGTQSLCGRLSPGRRLCILHMSLLI